MIMMIDNRTSNPMAEMKDLKSLQCGFESHLVYSPTSNAR